MLSPAVRCFQVALTLVVLAGCHGSGGDPAPVDTTPPGAPAGVAAAVTGPTAVDITWNAATDSGGSGIKDYIVYRGGVAVAFVTTTSFADVGLTASTLYSYEIAARDNANNMSGRSAAVTATTLAHPDVTPPSVPTGVIATVTSATTVNVSWSGASDPGGSGVKNYTVYRGGVVVTTVTTTSFVDSGLTANTLYSYEISARDNADNVSNRSSVATATTSATPDTTPPSVPGNLTASAASSKQIDLSWGAATDNVGVTGYRVERCAGAGCSNFAQFATPTGTTFSDAGLTPATSYRYRVRAVDAAGNPGPFSNTGSVTTLAPPDMTPPNAPATLTSNAVSATQINLTWGAATDDVGVTGYRVERCSGAGCASFAQIATPTGTSFNDTGLTASTSYSYRVRAVDAAANSGAYSNTSSVATQAAPDTAPPSAPGTLTSTALSSTQIDLSWGAATDNVGVTGYRVERCTGAGCSNLTQFATPAGTSFSDTGLTASTAYSYRVRAVDAAGNLGAYSNTSSATTQAAPDTTAPSAPGTLTASAVSASQINLSWGTATDDVGVTGYRVERCAGAGCANFLEVAAPTGTAFSDTGLTAATSYTYRVRAVDAENNHGAFSNTSGATTQAAPDITPPSAPAALTSSAVSSTQIDLSWNAATDDVGVTGYRVERCAGASCANFVQIATPAGTGFSDAGLTAATSYSYRVRAVDAAGNPGPFSNISSATTPDTTPPSAPGTLSSSAVSSSQIDLSWGAATDDVGVTSYRVERCTGAGCVNFVQIAAPAGTSFSDTGRTASTSYSYRVRAVDGAGNPGLFSNVSSATTPDTTPPSAPGTLTSSATSSTQIDLSWSASTDDVGVTGYRVERCSGAACANFAQTATPTGTSFSDTGLTASTSYSYRVRAVDAAGNPGPFSNISSAVTEAAADTTPPSAPGTLTSNAVSSSQVNLSWGVATDDVGVTGYRVERCSGAACNSFVQVGTPTGTSFSDSGLAPATSYSYRVRAVDAAGNPGAFSNTSSATTPDTSPPSAPGTLTSNAVSSSQINLSWGAATDDVGVTGYRVERCAGASCATFVQIATPTGTSFSDTGLTASTSYSYRVRAIDAAGNPGPFSNVGSATTPDTTAPSAPGTLSSSAVSSTQIDLAWGAATDDVGVTGYRLERCTGTGCINFAQIATPTGTSFSDTGLTVSTSYSYRVRAVDAAGNPGSFSNVSRATTPDTTPPSAPGTLILSAVSSTQIDLAWGAATDDVGVTGYRVERCIGTACVNFAQIATPSGTTFSDTGLTASTSYTYRVRAVDAASNPGAFSNTSSAATQAAPDTTPPGAPGTLTSSAVSSTQIDLSWGAATDNVGVTGYRVERCSGAGCSNFTQFATPTGTSYSDTGLIPSTSYSYRVRAVDAAANPGAFSNTSSVTTQAAPDTTAPNAPGTLTSSAVSSTQINLSWGAATDDVGVTGYRVERCSGEGCSGFTQIATPTGTSFNDTGLTDSTSYSYRVRAVDAAGNLGAFSNIGSATTPAGTSDGTFQNEVLISGMNLPTALRFLPNGDMLVLELGGKIGLVPAGTTQVNATPFLSLTNIGEGYQGLMDLTLDPDFESNHYYYVFYTLGSPNRDRVARFTVTEDHSGTVPGSEFVVYQDPQDAASEHHGGALNFGGDGKLYVTTGEQFNPPDSQDLSSPRGKILRINSDGSVPPDNPFYDGAGPNRDDVWALGLRNPFRAFYDSPSGRLYVADVGGNDYSTAEEEVHLGVAGANFGWPDCEGSSCAGDPTYTSPIYSYPHFGRDASITGGFIYRGNQFPAEYYGNYFFADYSQNWIRRLTFDAGGNVNGDFAFEPPDGSADGPYGDIVDLREGPDGALYYVDLGFSDTTGETGISKIRRIRFIPGDLPPTAAAAGTPTDSTTAPLTVNFSSAGSVDPEGEPLTYLWEFGDGATSTVANPTHVYGQLGAYSALLTVSDGTTSATSAPVQITVGNKPVPAITSPSDSALFRAGDAIAVTGTASDVEDGALPASAFSWTVDFLHAGHVHPGVPTTGMTSLVFPIPTSGHDFSGDTRYRITLTVTDSNGLKASRSVTIYPDKVNLTFDTVPSGLVIEIDGLPHTTPHVHDTLINFNHTINAPDQTVNGTANAFASWSDGGAQAHAIVVPAVDQSYTATYTATTPQFPSGLVAGYRLDESAGSVTADISGNNATGTLVGAPVWTTGRYGGALDFNGASYVDLGNPVPLRLTGSMTLSAWINISANPDDDGAIVGKVGGGGAGWQLKTSPDTGKRTAAIEISSNGSDSIQRYSSGLLAAGNWYHVAGVYDAAARTLQIYVNGVLDNGVLSGSVPAAQFDAPFNVNIAQRSAQPGLFNFLGRIDEVHVFNRALTASEIQTDMNLPR